VLSQSEPGDRLLTAVCVAGEVSGDLLELDVAVAGHPPPLILRRDQPCAEVLASGTLIGFEQVTFASAKLSLDPGESFVLYTDGLTDAHAPREFVVAEELCRRADELDRSDLGGVLDSLLDRASVEGTGLPRDDIALLGIQFAPRSPRGAGSLAAARHG
jgi:phosphoserine phosphatase RsbU/P